MRGHPKVAIEFVGFDSICCSRRLCWFVTRYPWLIVRMRIISKFFDQIWNPCLHFFIVFPWFYQPVITDERLQFLRYRRVFCAGIDFTPSIGLCFGSSCWNVWSWGKTCCETRSFAVEEKQFLSWKHTNILRGQWAKLKSGKSSTTPIFHFVRHRHRWAYIKSYIISNHIAQSIIHYFMHQIHILYAIYSISSCQIWNICGVPRAITPHGLRWKLANALGWKLTDSHAEARNL